MNRRTLGMVALLVAVMVAMPASASSHLVTDKSIPNEAAPSISLVVAGYDPHGTLSLFGHSYLVVKSPGEKPLAYSYQIYKSETGWSGLPSASIGRALMDLETKDATAVHRFYVEQGREVRQTHLNLDDAQARNLASLLQVVSDEEGLVPYHMIFENCSTKLRDMIDEAMDGELARAASGESEKTIRSLGAPYVQHKTVSTQAWNFLYGEGGDRVLTEWETMFIPREFERTLTELGVQTTNGESFAANTIVVSPSTYEPVGTGVNPDALLYGLSIGVLLIGALVAWAGHRQAVWTSRVVGTIMPFVGLLVGLAAVFMLIAWTGNLGSHLVRNQNILLASPLAWTLIPLGIMLWFNPQSGWRLIGHVALASLVLAAVALLIRFVPNVVARDNYSAIAFTVATWTGVLATARTAGGFDIGYEWYLLRRKFSQS